jgi:hypothetical protein
MSNPDRVQTNCSTEVAVGAGLRGQRRGLWSHSGSDFGHTIFSMAHQHTQPIHNSKFQTAQYLANAVNSQVGVVHYANEMSVLHIALNGEVHTRVELTFIQVALCLKQATVIPLGIVHNSERILRQLGCLLHIERPQ